MKIIKLVKEIRDEGINDHKLFTDLGWDFTIKAIPNVISSYPNYEEYKNCAGFIDLNELPFYRFGDNNIALYHVIANHQDYVGDVKLIDENDKEIILNIYKAGGHYYASFIEFVD